MAYSAGNHGQGLALSGKLLGIKTLVILPVDAPEIKKKAIAGYGAEVLFYDRYNENLDEVIQRIKDERGMTYISPFDAKHIIAGQGVAAQELIEETGELDYFFASIGGGGLISGCSLVTKEKMPNCKIIGVEPDAGHDAAMSV